MRSCEFLLGMSTYTTLRSGFLQITAQANPCSRHLWGTLARSVASIWWHQATPKNVLYLLSDSCIFKCRQVICTRVLDTRVEPQYHARRPHFINGSINNRHSRGIFGEVNAGLFLIVGILNKTRMRNIIKHN